MLSSFHAEEALILLKDAGERQLKLLGEHHPDLYNTECALILVYDISRGSTDYSLKVALLREHLQNLQQQRGLQNRGVLELKSSLGYTLWSQNRSLASPAAKKLTQEGVSLMIEAYDMQLKLYGKENDTAVEAASRLAKYYEMVKEWDKAESFHRQVYEAYRKRFGEEFPETLAVETRVSFAVIGQGRAKEGLEMLERIVPIQTRQSHDNPDRIALCLNLAMARVIMATALWGLDENEVALEMLRKESTERILELPELSQNAPVVQYLLQQLRLVDNLIRDDILATETRQWKPASAWPYPFKELEGFFPRKNQIHPSNIRRVKSWNAASTDLDQSPAQSPDEDRSATFRRLRGEPEPESEPPPAPARVGAAADARHQSQSLTSFTVATTQLVKMESTLCVKSVMIRASLASTSSTFLTEGKPTSSATAVKRKFKTGTPFTVKFVRTGFILHVNLAIHLGNTVLRVSII